MMSVIFVLLCFLLASTQTAALRVNGAPPSPSAVKALLHRSTVGASLIASLLVFDPAAAADLNGSGQKLFAANCAGCHTGGGNLLASGKTLKKDSLLKNGYLDQGKVQTLVSQGAGSMPPYGAFTSPAGNAMPAKLDDKQTAAVSQYVLQQAEEGWVPVVETRNCDEYPGC